MMSFKEMCDFLEGVKEKYSDDLHPKGTYASVTLSKESQKALDDWVTKNEIPNATDPSTYHSTLIYSRKGVPEAKDYKVDLPIKAKISKWSIFKTQQGKDALVAIMDSPVLTQHHKNLRSQYGATHDFPEYHPHVTISYDYGSDVPPKKIPDLELEYDSKEFKALDPDFLPPKKGTE